MELLDENFIWLPNAEHYGGYTDRHAVLSKNNIEVYLNILNNLVLQSNKYFLKMKDHNEWNLERLLKLHFEEFNVLNLIREFPYVMYCIRNINGKTRWVLGNYSPDLGYYIKYQSEFDKSKSYYDEFVESGLTINEFYNNLIILLNV
jgi:hypothetical protein